MKLSVQGLGIVSKIGNTQEIEDLLAKNEIRSIDLCTGHTLSIDFPDEFRIASSLIRRMSHFAKISLLSACYAMKDSGLDLTGKSVGIIQGSVYGPIISGIQAFDDLIDFGDNQLSPTNFSGSVFNTSATYLSLAFGIQGCTLSHTSGLDTLYNSLQTASFWLESGMTDYVILGIGDEYTPYFDHGFLSDETWQPLYIKKHILVYRTCPLFRPLISLLSLKYQYHSER
jgi:3-oxoacyl-(acyl-carrier-protein) synthase